MPTGGDEDGEFPERFEIVRELGAGGMGQVFEAIDRESGARVALKRLHREVDADAIDRLKDEFRVQVDLRHRNMVEVGELFEHKGRWCFSMELVDGVSWIEWVRRPAAGEAAARADDDVTPVRWDPVEARYQPRYDAGRLWDALGQLAEALDALHGAGICHRDVKPSNALVTADGRVVLLDLGLAAAFDRGRGDLTAGTVDYMAPEQANGATPSAANDIYSLGVMLYEALVGRPPFEGPAAEVLLRKVSGAILAPSALLPEVERGLDELCVALLAREPRERPSAAEVLRRIPGRVPRQGGVAPGHRRSEAILVGRDREVAQLTEALAAAVEGPRVVSIVGGPGMGKSALIHRLAAAARRAGHLVGLGVCRDREHVHLNGWDDLIDGLSRELARLPRTRQRALLPDGAEALAQVFPAATRIVDAAEVEGDAAELVEERAAQVFRELLARAAAARPGLIILDDAHRATAASLAWLDRVLDAGPLPALVVVAHRPPPADSPFERWLDRAIDGATPPQRLFLGPLDPESAQAMARYLTGDEQAARVLARTSGGHPLLLELMAESSDAAAGADAEAVLRDAVAAQPAELQTLLRVLAVAARPLELATLAIALGRDLSEVARLLGDARHHRLVRSTGSRRNDVAEPYHEMVRAAVVAQQPTGAAADAHRRLAAALDEIEALDLEERVAHWAAAGDGARAAALARQLLASADDGVAHAAAARVGDRVLAMTLPGPERAELLCATGDAWLSAGDARRAATAYLDASALLDGARRHTLEHRAAACLLRTGHLEQGLEVASRVAEYLGMPLDPRPAAARRRAVLERVRLRGRMLIPYRGPVRADRAELADACHALATGLAMGDFVRAAGFQFAALRHALASGAPDRIARELANEAGFLAATGHRNAGRVDALLARARTAAEAVGDAGQLGVIESVAAAANHLVGAFARSVEVADRARALPRRGRIGQVWEERIGEVMALRSLAWLGRWGELEQRRRRVERESDVAGDLFGKTFTSLAPSTLGLLGDGRLDEVEARMQRVDDRVGTGGQTPRFFAIYSEAMLALARRDGERALALLDQHAPAIKGSGVLRVEQVRATYHELRARAALQAAAGDERRLAAAALDARRAATAPWMEGPVALITAQLAQARGDQIGARRARDHAADACARHDLALHAAAARWLDPATRSQADAEARALGVGQPEVAFAVLVPGA